MVLFCRYFVYLYLTCFSKCFYYYLLAYGEEYEVTRKVEARTTPKMLYYIYIYTPFGLSSNLVRNFIEICMKHWDNKLTFEEHCCNTKSPTTLTLTLY